MAYLISTYDPRHEYVVLWQARFEQHILTRHVTATVDAIQRTIEAPDIITRDVDYPERDNYYALGADTMFPKAYLKVCVAFKSDTGRVVTAFPVDRPKPNEEILWSK